jgi:thiol-disulfide isomerase/thioredoxin
MQFKMRIVLATLLITSSLTLAQSPATPPVPATPPSPPPPSTGIRNKISAGDLLSAESILEVHRAKNGEDGAWLTGLSWLTRGALLLNDNEKAERYATQLRKSCEDRIAHGADMEKDHDLEYSYGTAIEVETQRLERTKGVPRAAEYIRNELVKVKGPVALIARLNKRLNMMTLEGKPAPELVVEDFLGNAPPTLASLRGKPVLIFIWAFGCGDCRAQEASLAKVKSRYVERGLQLVTLTRYYEVDSLHAHEKAQIDSVWKSAYSDMGTVPMVISIASAERYGGSSTPTFVFIDRAGIVRRYTPTRLTEEEFDRTLELLMR